VHSPPSLRSSSVTTIFPLTLAQVLKTALFDRGLLPFSPASLLPASPMLRGSVPPWKFFFYTLYQLVQGILLCRKIVYLLRPSPPARHPTPFLCFAPFVYSQPGFQGTFLSLLLLENNASEAPSHFVCALCLLCLRRAPSPKGWTHLEISFPLAGLLLLPPPPLLFSLSIPINRLQRAPTFRSLSYVECFPPPPALILLSPFFLNHMTPAQAAPYPRCLLQSGYRAVGCLSCDRRALPVDSRMGRGVK